MNTKIIYEPKGRAKEYAELAANLYKGCANGCTYCYVPTMPPYPKREEFHGHVAPRENIYENLRKDLEKLKGVELPPIFLCFTCDPYPKVERTKEITRSALKLFYTYERNFTILTKAGLRAARDFELYKPGDSFGATLVTINGGASAKWEPNASTPISRTQALIEASNQGIKTWISLEPIIDVEQALNIIKVTHSYVDHYKVGKLNYHPHAKTINWKDTAIRVKSLLDELGCDYYLKEDLRAYLESEGDNERD